MSVWVYLFYCKIGVYFSVGNVRGRCGTRILCRPTLQCCNVAILRLISVKVSVQLICGRRRYVGFVLGAELSEAIKTQLRLTLNAFH